MFGKEVKKQIKCVDLRKKDLNGLIVEDRGDYYLVTRGAVVKDDLGASNTVKGQCRVPRDATARHAFEKENREFFSMRVTKHLTAIKRQQNTPNRYQQRASLAFLRRGLPDNMRHGVHQISLKELKHELLTNKEEMMELLKKGSSQKDLLAKTIAAD